MSKTILCRIPPNYWYNSFSPASYNTVVLDRAGISSDNTCECVKPIPTDAAENILIGQEPYWESIVAYGGTGDPAQVTAWSTDPVNDTAQNTAASSYSVKVLHDLADTITAPDDSMLSDATDSQSSETIATSKAVKTAVSLADSSSVPAGFICAFYGNKVSVTNALGQTYDAPVDFVNGTVYTKWVVCSGYSKQTINGYTIPALYEKFLRCAVKEDAHFTGIGTTGGADKHNHTGTIEAVTMTASYYHEHEYLPELYSSAYVATGTATCKTVDTSVENELSYVGESGSHTHTDNGWGYLVRGDYHGNFPPYRQLFYICKLPDAPTEE